MFAVCNLTVGVGVRRIVDHYPLSQLQGNSNRTVLIPISAHEITASAVMGGLRVVVKSDEEGHIYVEDLKAKAEYKDSLWL